VSCVPFSFSFPFMSVLRAGKLYDAALDFFEAISLTTTETTERDRLVEHFHRVQVRVEACQQKAAAIGELLW
jgi:hypothetical protein